MAENGLHFRKKTEDAIKRYLALSPTNECAIGVYKNGKIGYRASKDDLNRKFDIGSISKTFTAHHILKLCHVGLLELDTTVDHYLVAMANSTGIKVGINPIIPLIYPLT